MNGDKEIIFSIIITCHDRKKYVTEAIQSAASQDFNKDLYEIILVKNFQDPEIDSVAEKNNVRLVMTMEKPLSRKMVEGIKVAVGRYILFLDDDDLFAKHKLSRIMDFIEDDNLLAYYHNSYQPIDENGSFLDTEISLRPPREIICRNKDEIKQEFRSFIRYRADWYASMMCIRSDLIRDKLDHMWKIPASADKFVFFAGISSGQKIIIDNDQGTLYRIHPSLTTVLSTFQDFISKKSSFYNESLESFKIINSMYRDTYLNCITYCFLLHARTLSSFVDKDRKLSIIREFIQVTKCTIRLRYYQLFIWYFLTLVKAVTGDFVLHVYYNINQSSIKKATASSKSKP